MIIFESNFIAGHVSKFQGLRTNRGGVAPNDTEGRSNVTTTDIEAEAPPDAPLAVNWSTGMVIWPTIGGVPA